MKTLFFAVSMLAASTFAFATPALPGVKAKAAPQTVQTGPRQFIQSMALSNGAGATITLVADWSEEAHMQTVLTTVLADLSRVDQEVNGGEAGQLAKINALTKGQEIQLSDELYAFISKAKDLADLTNGWFDITRSSTGGWFNAKNFRKISLDDTKKTLTFKGDDMQIDISSIWPAYLVDYAMTKLAAEGITNAKVEIGNVNRNIGQDIYTAWNVSVDIPNPNSANAYRSYVYSFSNKAVASLVPERLSTQIIDPRNNEPVSNTFKNVTVFGGDSMTASAFAVALYTLGPKDAVGFADQHPEIKSIFVDDSGKLISSRDLTITHPNYSAESETAAPTTSVDKGPNDLNKKKAEESKD